jgi:ankyrin repeat protein
LLVSRNRYEGYSRTYSQQLAALWLAARYGLLALCESLFGYGCEVDETTSDGDTALCTAAEIGFLDIVVLLLNQNAWPSSGSNRKFDMLPLLSAAHAGTSASVEALLEKGANINDRDRTGRTALHAAISNGKVTLIPFLLDNGADVDAYTHRSL